MARTVLGVDLGTTNTVVAVFDGATMRVVADQAGEHVTPSVVSFHPNGKVLVGNVARERRVVDAENTVFSVKRLIGRPFDAPEVRAAARRLPFELRASDSGGVLVRAREQTYSLPEISAFVLRRVRQLAKDALGEEAAHAIVTVPANFNELQRTATRDAGRIAGLNVLRILNEPTAAALAYGFSGHEGERIAVYDFGGGTFDVSILELGGDVIEVIATAGDSSLGGDDVDALIADRMADDFLARERIDLRRDRVGYERLRQAAEWLKRQLSYLNRVEVQIESIAHGGRGRSLDLRYSMTQEELAELMGPVANRSFEICERAMTLARTRPTQLDAVILVGGQTRSPLLARRVAEYFEREPRCEIDPDQVVAMGAAIHGHTLLGGVVKKHWTTASVGGSAESTSRPSPERKVYGFDEEPTRLASAEPLREPPPRVLVPPPPPPPSHDDATVVSPPPRDVLLNDEATRVVAPPSWVTEEAPPRAVPDDASDDALTQVFVSSEHALPAPTRPSSAPPKARASGAAPPLTPAEAPARERRPSVPPPSRSSSSTPSPAPRRASTPAQPRPSVAPRRTGPSAPAPPAPLGSTLRGTAPRGPLGRTTLRGTAPPPAPVAPSSGTPPRGRTIPSVAPPQSPAATSPQAPPAPQPGPTTPPPTASEAPRPTPPPSSLPAAVSEPPAPALPPTPRPPSALVALSSEPPSATPARAPTPLPGDAPPLRMAPRPSRAPASPSVAPPPVQVPALPMPELAAPQVEPTASERPGPLLLDVTPHTLAVETVAGYCERVIEQNAPIPTEQTRLFSTSQDNQSRVSVRVCQGEDRRMEHNQILGAVELLGLPPGPRGRVKIAVTFELDSDGTLHVRARDQDSGKAQQIRINLVGALDSGAVDRLRARQDALVVEA